MAEALWAYRTTKHSTTRHSPFEVKLGRRAWLGIDRGIQRAEEKSLENGGRRKTAAPGAQADAEQNIRNRAQKLRELSRRQRRAKDLHPDQLVLIRNRARNTKLDDRWIGPFKVIDTPRPETVVVKFDNGVHQTLHRNDVTGFNGLPGRAKRKTTKPLRMADYVEGSSSGDESDWGGA